MADPRAAHPRLSSIRTLARVPGRLMANALALTLLALLPPQAAACDANATGDTAARDTAEPNDPLLSAEAARIATPTAEAQTIALGVDRQRRMTVPVTIADTGPYRFMVDTGSQATAVTRDLQQRLSLPLSGRATLVAMASRRDVDLVRLDALEVGSAIFDGIDAPVLERGNVGADGIIGLDSLQDFRVLMDFRADTMTLVDGADARGRRGFEIVVRAKRRDNQLVITEAIVEGVRAAVIIDTGAQASIGNKALQRRIRARRQGEIVTTDINGQQLVGQFALARSLRIDNLELNNLAVSWADTPAFEQLGYKDRPALSLGMDHLRMFDRVAIDFDKRRVLFDMPRGSRRSRHTRIDLPQ